MSNTSVQTRPGPGVTAITPQPRHDPLRPVKKVLKALASLRLTVVLFLLSMVLVFCGTLAQMDEGLYSVLANYFRCKSIVWIPFQIFVRFGQVFFGVPPDAQVAGSFPFPGGWLIGGALLVNLLAAHAVRFKLSWKRSGILIIHSGLILLMLGELVTGLFAVEGSMTIPVGGASNYVENLDRIELAFTTPRDDKTDDVVVIPEAILRKGGVIRDERLPVDVEVVRYLVNSYLPKAGAEAKPDADNPATKGFGQKTVAIEQKPGRGVDADQKRDVASAYVTFKDKNSGESLGTYLVSAWLNPQEVEVGDKTYQVALRQERAYKPYTFYLKKLDHETYKGTGIAKNYSSLIQLKDDNGEDREVLIWMNHPLFYRGETFYQIQVLNGGAMTGLQVVRNPGWMLPYISCFMVAFGMVVHFGLHLRSFFGRRTAQ